MPTVSSKALVCALLAVATLAVFWQVRGFDFINYDDTNYVVKNPRVQQGFTAENVRWMLTTAHAANWHPLTWMSHTLDWQLFGARAGGHHLVSVFIHLANALLLFAALRLMTRAAWASAFVAALFAIHPLHVQSVAWVAERKDVLSGLFWMLTLVAHARYAARPGAGRYLLTLFFFALGLTAQPRGVTLKSKTCTGTVPLTTVNVSVCEG